MLLAAGQLHVGHGAARRQVGRIMQDAAAALAGDEQICRNYARIKIKIVSKDRALQALEHSRVALERVEPTVIFDDAGTERGVEAEIGADVENDRPLRQKGPEDANDIGFVLPAENIAKRLESSRIDAEVFARGEPHQRPIGSDSDWAADFHSLPSREEG